jgi:hypothetical protein
MSEYQQASLPKDDGSECRRLSGNNCLQPGRRPLDWGVRPLGEKFRIHLPERKSFLNVVVKRSILTFGQGVDLDLLRREGLKEDEELVLNRGGEDGAEVGNVRVRVVEVFQQGQAVPQPGKDCEFAL